MTIGIVGLGYVGLTLAIAAADSGIEVHGVEINKHIRECLKNNRAHFFEPGLDELIEKHNGKTFFCDTSFPTNIQFDAFVITVGTPLLLGEKVPNFSYIKEALSSLKGVYNGDQLVILRSTVSVGTTRNTVLPFLEKMTGRTQDNLYAAMCPERTVEGKAVEELRTLPQVISGNNNVALKKAEDVFLHITSSMIKAESLEEAELIKLYNNTYRDMTFAIGNAFCLAAQTFGVNGIDVIRHANEGYDRSDIKIPGFVAGPCLEKDAYLLTNNMVNCQSRDYILEGRHINESLEEAVVDWVDRVMKNSDRDRILTLSGMAFKGRPATSDLRGSTSVYIAQKLKKHGYELRLHDYVADKDEMESLQLGTVYEDLCDACKDSSLLLILNNYPRYETLTKVDIDTGLIAVFDSWNVCKGLVESQCGIPIETLGTINMS